MTPHMHLCAIKASYGGDEESAALVHRDLDRAYQLGMDAARDAYVVAREHIIPASSDVDFVKLANESLLRTIDKMAAVESEMTPEQADDINNRIVTDRRES